MELFDTVVTDLALVRVAECLSSGYISEGKIVKEFEKALENEFGYKYGVAVNSGTAALHLVLHEIGTAFDNEVIIPAQTFIATGMAVLYCGAKVVFADIDVETGNISVEDVARKITFRTKAVIAVSWGGNPCRLDELQKLCDENDVYLIQDNAQALGATYKDKPVTEWGDFSCFSFQATKHLSTGDGGLIVPSSKVDCEILKNLRWFNIDREIDLPDETGERQYILDDIGFKYHMNDFSAALGLGNLVGIQKRIEKRRKIAWNYFSKIKEIFLPIHFYAGSSYWIYDLFVEKRSDFISSMRERDIPVSVVHQGIDKHPIFKSDFDLPKQRYWDAHHVCLPCHSSMTWEEVERVVDAVNLGW